MEMKTGMPVRSLMLLAEEIEETIGELSQLLDILSRVLARADVLIEGLHKAKEITIGSPPEKWD